MSYVDRKRSEHRASTLIVVAVLEAAAIYAVITGLNLKLGPPPPRDRLIADNIPLPKPSPPPPQIDPVKPPEFIRPVVQPRPQLPGLQPHRPIERAIVIDTGPPVPPIVPDPPKLIDLPKPTPSPGLLPRLARPRGSPAQWATTNDYPARDLREGNQGLVRFSLTVGASGKVEACVITASSGHPRLDAATCENVSRRARFDPATDASGAKVTGAYSGSIRWVIPED